MCAKAWVEFDELLINKVRKFPYLYNYNMREFRNYAAKQSAWKAIAEEIGCEGNVCQRRWRLIRDSYVRYKRDKESPAIIHHVRKEKNPAMDVLNFLDAFVKHRSVKTEANVDDLNYTADCDEGFGQDHVGTSLSVGSDNDEDSLGSSAQFPAFLGTNAPIKSEYLISKCKEDGEFFPDSRVHQSSTMVVGELNEELECFVRSVFGTLHRFTPKQRAIAKVRIQQVLLAVEYGDDNMVPLTHTPDA